jgi:hypothetical protein
VGEENWETENKRGGGYEGAEKFSALHLPHPFPGNETNRAAHMGQLKLLNNCWKLADERKMFHFSDFIKLSAYMTHGVPGTTHKLKSIAHTSGVKILLLMLFIFR